MQLKIKEVRSFYNGITQPIAVLCSINWRLLNNGELSTTSYDYFNKKIIRCISTLK